MQEFLSSVDEVFKEYSSSDAGITLEEAEKRLAEHGKNELEKQKKKSLFLRLVEQLANPMVIVLLIAAAVSVVITIIEGGGFKEYAEAGIILAVVILNSVLGVVQEGKAEHAIEALSSMSAASAKVRRGGVILHIPASELVPGDVVLLEAGSAVPADMRLTVAASLKIEEAALTGESVPVDKVVEVLSNDENGKVPLGDRKNMAYMGSAVTYGRGEGIVVATGMKTEMGKIARLLQTAKEGQTPLQKRLSQLSKVLSIVVLGICALIFIVRVVTSGEYNASGLMSSFMLAVALAVAAIPEGLAAVVTMVLSIGVTKMAKQRAIIRRLTAVETLGCAQIICSDKTGTLTQNRMTVVDSYGETGMLAKAMALCCDSEVSSDGSIIGDPTENALVDYAIQQGVNVQELNKEFPRIAEAPFDSKRKMMSTFHQDSSKVIQYTKGAPDEVLRCCSHAVVDGRVVTLTPEITGKILAKNNEFANRALRVLAVASREHSVLQADSTLEKFEKGLTFIGLQAMIDPVRPEVKAAVQSCSDAGIKVVMITGDHKETAIAIAKELGIIQDAAQAMTGRELDELSDAEFEKRIETTFVYARVQPEHKVRIVHMWKQKGFITAMTGDGVNDAPAIKSGDIGVGMGITGTDVTKNVADMVLADDNFATIVSAVGEGRRIYDNIQKTIQFLLSTNLSEVLAIFTATLIGFALFKPVHLLFINLVTDTLPAVALGMEDAQGDAMSRPPREKDESIFSRGVGINIIYQGSAIAVLTLAAYFIADFWFGAGKAMTAAFVALCFCEVFQAWTMRSLDGSVFRIKKQNKALWAAIAASMAMTLAVVYIPFLADMFSLVPLTLIELAIVFAIAFAIVPVIEIVKAICRLVIRKRGKRASV